MIPSVVSSKTPIRTCESPSGLLADCMTETLGSSVSVGETMIPLLVGGLPPILWGMLAVMTIGMGIAWMTR